MSHFNDLGLDVT